MAKIQFKVNRNTVTANTYVVREIYKRNALLVEELGGEMVMGNERFTAKFTSNAKAKAFVEQAETSISKKEYNACRKTEPKAKPVSGKGKKATTKGKGKYITLTDDDGNEYKVPMSALGIKGKGNNKKPAAATAKKGKGKTATAKKVTKGKGKALTEKQKQHKAYEMANASFKRRVAHSTWLKKYNKILESL